MREKSPIVLFWSMALILASLATSVAAAEVTLEGGINGSLGDDVSSGVARAIDYVLSCQNDDGGFGNGIGKPSDQRETSEAAMALALAGGLDRA
ncbi:MAG: prenyltransferase/squalene oxidase repeat-containing protein, partial [Methanothrix sp.]